MSEVAGAQTILLSNSNKKGTSITIGFADDGSVYIQSEGPVTGSASEVLTWLFEDDSFAPLAKLSAGGQAQSVVCDHLGTPLTLHNAQGAVARK